METSVLKIEERTQTGKKVKKLRREGILPANVYGKKIKSVSVQVNKKEFESVYKQIGETGLVELVQGKVKRPALIHDVQIDPVTDEPIHVEFLQVDLKQKVSARVPVELEGVSPAEKGALGTVVQHVNEVEIEALPTEIPEKFVIDISSLTAVDQAIYVKDLKADKKKVEIKDEPDKIIVKVEPPTKEEAVVSPPAAETAAEATAETTSDGETSKSEVKSSES
jgi:large subunit ribosomal protein L25